MACGCSKNKPASITPQFGSSGVQKMSQQQDQEMTVQVEYIGAATQGQRINSRVNPRHKYTFSGDERLFKAYAADAEWLSSMKHFRIAQELAPRQVVGIDGNNLIEVPTITSEMPAMPRSDLPIEALNLDPIVMGILKKKFRTASELRNAGRNEWLTVKGMGDRRADLVQEALDAIH